MTSGNQKWKGAAPVFSKRAELIIIEEQFWLKLNWLIKFILIIDIRIAKSKIEEAKAWVRKYFNEASVDIKLFVLIIKGINDNKLISNPTQAPNQELEETVIIVLLIKVKKNNNLAEFLNIKKKRIKTFINGV